MIRKSLLAAAAGLLFAAGQAGAATTINFENLAEGAVLASQYSSLGVIFSPNAFSGANSNTTTQGWATNTGMTITSLDTGALGTPLLVSGNILHSFDDYLGEDGDPSMLATFTTPINSISIDFAGIFTGSDVTLTAYNGSTVLGTVAAPTCAATCQATLSFAAASITKVAFTPGSYADWVGVDNITFNTVAVPEVSTYAMMGLGLGLLAFRRRQRD